MRNESVLIENQTFLVGKYKVKMCVMALHLKSVGSTPGTRFRNS